MIKAALIVLVLIFLVGCVTPNVKYLIVNAQQRDCSELFNVKHCLDVKVQNVDNVLGVFTLSCDFKALERTVSNSAQIGISSGETKTLTCVGDLDFGEDFNVNYYVDGRRP